MSAAAPESGPRSEIAAEVVALIARVSRVPAEKLAPDVDLRGQLGLDSLTGLKVLAALEKRFGFTVPEEEIDRCRTVGAAVALAERLAGGEGRGS